MKVRRPGLVGTVAIGNMVCATVCLFCFLHGRPAFSPLGMAFLSPTLQILEWIFSGGRSINAGKGVDLFLTIVMIVFNAYIWGGAAWLARATVKMFAGRINKSRG